MRGLETFSRVFLHRDPVDMRKSINGLSTIVIDEMEESFESDRLFVFVGRCGKRLKILYWDRSGFALWTKRLEKERFRWPKTHDEAVVVTSSSELTRLLSGFDIFQKPHVFLQYSYIG